MSADVDGADLDLDREDVLPDHPEIDEPLRPALAKLVDDQIEALEQFVEGFDSRADLIRWSGRAIVATVGELPDDWYTELATSRSDLATLITSSRRRAWAADDEPPTESAAATYRRALAAEDLVPAFHRGFRKLRWSATEYVNDDGDELKPSPADQAHPAMRPALSELRERQRWALDRALEGFGGRDDVIAWAIRAMHAAHGELDDALARDLYRETHTRRMLVVEPEDAPNGPFFRESLAAIELLPPFNRAAREVAERAGELAEQQTQHYGGASIS